MRVTILIMIALCLPLSAQEKASRFKLAEGLVATPWATSPQILNPTNMDVDERGRIWITEAVNYRDFRNTPKGRLTAPKGDRVRVLEDTDGDGVCDSSKVFVQDVDLVAPLGLAVIGNKVFVSCSPSLLVFTDTDGDDVADKKEVLLSGFGGKDHDHGLHALVGGPGGRLWFNTGNAGPHVVRDKNGWTLRSGSIYNDGFNTNVPGLKSDDGRIWTGGITLSMEPDGSDLRVHSHNYRNCYEIAVDAFGDVWQNDNDDDGNQGCRIARVPAGANMGFFSADGTRTWGADRRPGQTTPSAHWHQEDPGVFPSGEITGAGAPTGIAVYETGALGEGWAGTLLSADAGRSAVFYSRPALRNSSYHWKSEILIQPTDPEDRWFRPADIVVGADGALYLADWHDPVVGGHLMRDKKGGGTIYRIAPPRSATKPIPVDLSSVAGAVQALKHPLIHVRYRAADALRAFGKKADPALSELLATGTEAAKARAVWLLAESDGLSEVVMNTLVHASPRLRITAMRALIATGHDPLRLANIVLSDRHPAVRAEFACHLRGLPYK